MKKLGGLKAIPALLRRQAPKKAVSYTQDLILVENLEKLVDLYIQEIIQPLDLLALESPTVQSPLQYTPQSPPRVMVGVVNQPA